MPFTFAPMSKENEIIINIRFRIGPIWTITTMECFLIVAFTLKQVHMYLPRYVIYSFYLLCLPS